MRTFVVCLLLPCGLLAAGDRTPGHYMLLLTAKNQPNQPQAFCDTQLGDWDYHVRNPYTIQPGDRLEYDVLFSPSIPDIGGGLGLQFRDGTALVAPVDATGPANAKAANEGQRPPVGRWQHLSMSLGVASGKQLGRWFYRLEGKSPGLYQVVLDNLRITNGKRVPVSFYQNQPAFSSCRSEYQGFRTATLMVLPSSSSDGSDLAPNLERLYQSALRRTRMAAIRQGIRILEEDYERTGEPKLLPTLLQKAYAVGDLQALQEMRIADFDRQLDEGMKILEPLTPAAKRNTIHVVGHAHLDFLWMWSWAETIATAQKDFQQILQFMDEFPEFTFSCTNPALFEAIERQDPALFVKIQRRAREGRWEMAGSRWCEADANLISEESHARQLLQAHRYNRERFGTESIVDFEPDIFGHPGFLPQVLRKAGVEFYVSRRMSHSASPFWWEGTDGSRVLTYPVHHYMDVLNSHIPDFCLDAKRRAAGWKDGLIVFGVGNHGGGPSEDQIQTGVALNRTGVYPAVIFSSLERFHRRISREPPADRLPVVRGDMQQPFTGTYALGGEIKRLNRACENTLTAAESWAAIAHALGAGPPANRFDNAWRALLWAQHHDTIAGTVVPASAVYARKILRDLLDDVRSDLKQTLAGMAAIIQTTGISDQPQVVFNPVAWRTTPPVTLALPDPSRAWEWVDPSGQPHPIQSATSGSTKNEGIAVLDELPSLGYRTIWLRPAEKTPVPPLELQGRRRNPGRPASPAETLRAQGRFLEVEVSTRSGNITRLVHQLTGRNWIPSGQESGRFRVDYEKPHSMSAWFIGPIVRTRRLDQAASVECVEAGPVRVVYRSRYQLGRSQIAKDTILYRELARVDFVVRVDWREKGGEGTPAPLLRMEFPSPFQSAEAIHLVPFGEIRRPQDGIDYCASSGMGLSGTNGSLCVFNNYKCSYSATNDVVRLTLLRSPYDPDPAPDAGLHTIPLALEITDQPWRSARFSRHGMEFNRTPTVIPSTPHDGRLPREHRFVSVEPSTALVTALKTAYDSPSNLVLRVCQADGSATRATIVTSLPFSHWREADLIERPLTNAPHVNPQSVALKGGEIKTFMLERK